MPQLCLSYIYHPWSPSSLLGQNRIKCELSQYKVSSSFHLWMVDQVPPSSLIPPFHMALTPIVYSAHRSDHPQPSDVSWDARYLMSYRDDEGVLIQQIVSSQIAIFYLGLGWRYRDCTAYVDFPARPTQNNGLPTHRASPVLRHPSTIQPLLSFLLRYDKKSTNTSSTTIWSIGAGRGT
jgi:hypothetical protein